jgi:hypothetical protein
MTKRTALAPLLLALVTAALVAPAASSAASSACVAGATTVAGKKATRFCGPASAVAKVGAKTLRFSGGLCKKSGPYFTINIGTTRVTSTANTQPGPLPYFGATVFPAESGTYRKQVLTWTIGGKRSSLLGDLVTLKPGLKSGTFSGYVIGSSTKVTGTFSCE